MCNACGYYCCGSDEFDRCGCEGCPDPDCWPDDPDDDEPDYDVGERYGCMCSGCSEPGRFFAEECE